MSEYGQLWEQIRVVRTQLSDLLGVPTSELSQLPESIRLAADRARRASSLLALWAELEAKAAKLEPESR